MRRLREADEEAAEAIGGVESWGPAEIAQSALTCRLTTAPSPAAARFGYSSMGGKVTPVIRPPPPPIHTARDP